MFKIEKNIPIPISSGGYFTTFSKMDVGDSFFVPFNPVGVHRPQISCYRYARRYAKQHSRYFQISIRTVRNKGFRVWRVK